jgi:hypothetical protein
MAYFRKKDCSFDTKILVSITSFLKSWPEKVGLQVKKIF